MSGGTPKRPIRMPDELWEAVQAKAEAEGTNASEVVRRLLADWVKRG
jgi:predicted DNA binding CopG/RHH family protein